MACLAGMAGLAALQQQLLLVRPPRLLAAQIQPIRSGAAALDVTFNRPMVGPGLADSSLHPDQPHRWFGRREHRRLLLEAGSTIQQALRLDLRGQDLRGLPLTPQVLWWDPRPQLLAVVPSGGGVRLALRHRDGPWRPLTAVQQRILHIEPLGDGSGVAMVTEDAQARLRVVLQRMGQRALALREQGVGDPTPGRLEQLESGPLMFAQLSSSQRGDLLVQLSGTQPGSDRIWIQAPGQNRRALTLEASGALRLLPDGNGLVLPSSDGLELLPLGPSPRSSPRQTLPGSREVKAFCSGSGRAVLVRHWPDYRRSVELVMPSRPPRQVWVGDAGVMAAACDNGGDRLWLVLRDVDRQVKARDELLLLNSRGTVLRRSGLGGWLLGSGAGLDFDPVSDQLLTVVERQGAKEGRPALINGGTLSWQVLDQPAVLARWLPAGGAWPHQ
jgi:hypothetical protein